MTTKTDSTFPVDAETSRVHAPEPAVSRSPLAAGSPLSVPLAMREIAPMKVAAVFQFVCEQFGLTQIEVCSERRLAQYAYARFVGYWLCRELTLASYPQIGRMFGGRDHTTVMHGCRKVDEAIKNNQPLGAQAEFLKCALMDRLQ